MHKSLTPHTKKRANFVGEFLYLFSSQPKQPLQIKMKKIWIFDSNIIVILKQKWVVDQVLVF
jgi:hypothetical protein